MFEQQDWCARYLWAWMRVFVLIESLISTIFVGVSIQWKWIKLLGEKCRRFFCWIMLEFDEFTTFKMMFEWRCCEEWWRAEELKGLLDDRMFGAIVWMMDMYFVSLSRVFLWNVRQIIIISSTMYTAKRINNSICIWSNGVIFSNFRIHSLKSELLSKSFSIGTLDLFFVVRGKFWENYKTKDKINLNLKYNWLNARDAMRHQP